MLLLDSDCSVLNHESEVVERDSNHKNWHVVSKGARLQQIYRKIEEVVVLAGVQLLREDELVHLTHLRVEHSAVDVLDWSSTLLSSKVENNLPYKDTPVEHRRKVVSEVCWVIFLCANPVLDEAGGFHKGAECVKGLDKFLVGLLSVFIIACV